MGRRVWSAAAACVLPVLILGAWIWQSRAGESLFFPPLSEIASAFREDWFGPNLALHVVPSLQRMSIGFLLAVVIGVTLGTAMGLSGRFRRDVRPITEYLRATPSVALIPLAFVVIGPGSGMEIAIITYGTTWPIVVATTDAIAGVDPQLREAGRAFGLSKAQTLRHVVLPSALPGIAAGVHVATQFAVGLMVLANFVGASEGLGYFVLNAQSSFDISSTWSGVLLLGILGVTVTYLVRLPERFALAWHRGWRAAARAE